MTFLSFKFRKIESLSNIDKAGEHTKRKDKKVTCPIGGLGCFFIRGPWDRMKHGNGNNAVHNLKLLYQAQCDSLLIFNSFTFSKAKIIIYFPNWTCFWPLFPLTNCLLLSASMQFADRFWSHIQWPGRNCQVRRGQIKA